MYTSQRMNHNRIFSAMTIYDLQIEWNTVYSPHKQCDLKRLGPNEYILCDSIYITYKDRQNPSMVLGVRWVIVIWWLINWKGAWRVWDAGNSFLFWVLVIQVQFLKTEQNTHFVCFFVYVNLQRKVKKEKNEIIKALCSHWLVSWICIVMDLSVDSGRALVSSGQGGSFFCYSGLS